MIVNVLFRTNTTHSVGSMKNKRHNEEKKDSIYKQSTYKQVKSNGVKANEKNKKSI